MSWLENARRMALWEPSPRGPLETRAGPLLLPAPARGRDLERKVAFDMQPIGIGGRPQYPDTDIQSLQRAYIQSPLVFACVGVRAGASQSPRLIVEAKQGGKWTEVDGHPLRQLIMHPNDEDDEAAFTRAAIVSLDTAGVFYAEIERGKVAGAPVGLHPLNPANVAPIPGEGNKPKAYEYRDSFRRVEIPAADMLVRRLPHPLNRWQGLSPLAVALGTVDADNGLTDYVRAFFNNAGIIAGILNVEGRVDQEGADAIRDKWRAMFGRLWGRMHDVAVLDSRINYQPVGGKLNELESAVLRSIGESRIAMVYGVPPLIIYAYIGLLRATYNNLPAAYRGFWELTMAPWFAAYAGWLTWKLLPEYVNESLIRMERIRCRYDLSEVAALQDNADGTQARARENFKEGGITLNEFREAVGEEPDPAGDYYVRRVAFVATRFGTDVADIPAGAGTTGTGDVSGQAMDELDVRLAKLEAGAELPAGEAQAPDELLPLAGGRQNGRHG